MSAGRFITLEGGEGAGKSTHAAFIRDWLQARGREVLLTREPGGSPLAEEIRRVVLQGWAEGVGAESEVLLMFAARAAHLRATVLPALAAGRDVVCDRFVDSSYAYQGAGKGLDERHIAALESLVLGDFRPQLTLVFDLPPEQGLARARGRGEVNRFEDESLAYMARVRECFLRRAAAGGARYQVIDAAPPLEQVRESLRLALESRL
ncbi:dTMP kinase [Solimonas sp. K1W22B-7]|uniref:dTMP kinase n=1 Tax=Solimonas sp. K1W22B-7 TaxID=2303331 RepID=UPI000E33032D|nr:dTMP kinase [Solimonas sp. K1W22B-7]AXQ29432.1 dTMP kinase [Solimonas sp. K1W22B-7]